MSRKKGAPSATALSVSNVYAIAQTRDGPLDRKRMRMQSRFAVINAISYFRALAARMSGTPCKEEMAGG